MRVLEKIQNIASLTLIHLHTEEQSLPPWPSEHKFGSSRFRRLWDITLFESHNTVFLAINYIDIVIIINIVRFTPWYFWNCGQHCPQNNSKHCPMIHVFIWTQPQWVLGTLSPGPTEKSSGWSYPRSILCWAFWVSLRSPGSCLHVFIVLVVYNTGTTVWGKQRVNNVYHLCFLERIFKLHLCPNLFGKAMRQGNAKRRKGLLWFF